MWKMEDNRRYVPTPKRKKKEKKETNPVAPRQENVRYNFKETVQLSCGQAYDKPCRCRRVAGQCVTCSREVVVTVGERAEPLQIDRNRITNYKCNRCRVNGR